MLVNNKNGNKIVLVGEKIKEWDICTYRYRNPDRHTYRKNYHCLKLFFFKIQTILSTIKAIIKKIKLARLAGEK